MSAIFKKSKKRLFAAPKTKLGRRIRDPFGNLVLLKRVLTSILGAATYRRFNIVNKTQVEGMEYLKELPETNVLFVSNHQTYFADVMVLYHIFASAKWRLKNNANPIYLLLPRAKTYYIAAEETMKDSGWLPKIFSYAGAVTIKRSWRHKGEAIKRGADIKAPDKIKKALDYGWVITFPQGTTTPDAPIQRGTAHLIKSFNPMVVHVKIDGFREAFDKKGLRYRKKGVKLSVKFEAPFQFGADSSIADIQQFL
ncbi:MAG: 1-acyl-sn-glycerol-3-phosphate acyltransferase, partial [Saprospiraceae bacterium]